MAKPFTRERRYHVLKLKDLEKLPAKHIRHLAQIDQAVFAIRRGKPLECVVVESDWPIYEATWQQIEAYSKGKHIIRDPNRVLSALCNSVIPAPMDHETVEDVAERVTRLSVSPFITEVEADAIRNAIDAITRDPQAGPVGLGTMCVLEDLLTRNGIAVDPSETPKSVYDYYAAYCNEKGVVPLPPESFPVKLFALPRNEYNSNDVRSDRLYYNTYYKCLCYVVANYWDDGATYIAERYTDDITDQYFTTEAGWLREVVPPVGLTE